MFTWNWADLIIAFLGFLSAIGAAFLTKRVGNILRSRKIVNEIYVELNSEINRSRYEEYSKRILNGEELNFKLIEMPHIEGIVASKEISLLSNRSWYGNLVSLKNDIDEINKWATLDTICFTYESSKLYERKTNCVDESLHKRISYVILNQYHMLLERINILYIAIKQKES